MYIILQEVKKNMKGRRGSRIISCKSWNVWIPEMWEQSAEFISSALSALSLRHDLFLFFFSVFHLFLFLFYPSPSSLSNLPSYQAISYSSNCEYVDFWWWLYFSFGFCWLKVFWAWSKNTFFILTITTWTQFFFFEFTLCKKSLVSAKPNEYASNIFTLGFS